MACVAETVTESVVYSWQTDARQRVPEPEGMFVHIKLWTFHGATVNLTQDVEVVVSGFEHVPYAG